MQTLVIIILGLIAALLVIALVFIMAEWSHETWESVFNVIFCTIVIGGVIIWLTK